MLIRMKFLPTKHYTLSFKDKLATYYQISNFSSNLISCQNPLHIQSQLLPQMTVLCINKNNLTTPINNETQFNSVSRLNLQRFQEKNTISKNINEKLSPLTKGCHELSDESLLLLASLKYPPHEEARSELLKRYIMVTDNVSYKQACVKFSHIATSNSIYLKRTLWPYKISIGVALTAGFASFPLCFYLPIVSWFNHKFVTMNVPQPEDLETPLEVGSWAWNWMEPPLGQISFFLLCLQFARSQMTNIGMDPWTTNLRQRTAQKLCDEYPQYDRRIVTDYSVSVDITPRM